MKSRAANPAQIGTDIKNAISASWDSLKASHAAAAKQGPEAEAKWWGETIGRVTFEVASTFVPVAGQVGKGSKVVKGVDTLADGVRASDKVANGSKVAETLLNRARRILGDLPLNSKSLDDLYRSGKLSMDEARALAKDVHWKDNNGGWIYPPNDGFAGKPIVKMMQPPAKIDRYGGFYKDGIFEDRGNFLSDAGASFGSRALPADSLNKPYKSYSVMQAFEVKSGPAASWFDQPGGGMQHKTEKIISVLIERGYIKEKQ